MKIPVTILRAGGQADSTVFNLSASPTAPDLAVQFPNAIDVPLPGYSHFHPDASTGAGRGIRAEGSEGSG
ncbi:MAG: hypothetical protein U0703_04260 [Anaerolineae bacterium]